MCKYNVEEKICFPAVTVARCLGVGHGSRFDECS
jgi:hypothetical protein